MAVKNPHYNVSLCNRDQSQTLYPKTTADQVNFLQSWNNLDSTVQNFGGIPKGISLANLSVEEIIRLMLFDNTYPIQQFWYYTDNILTGRLTDEEISW